MSGPAPGLTPGPAPGLRSGCTSGPAPGLGSGRAPDSASGPPAGGASTSEPASALGRVLGRPVAQRRAAEPCELCGEPLPGAHAHLLEERKDLLLCACRACALLFEHGEGAPGRFLLVPDRRLRLSGPSPSELGVPVGLAFFVRGSDGAVVAHYPSPAGATRWEVDAAAWDRLASRHEELASMRPAVEAFLVAMVRGMDERWLVPIDDCHRLVALVRREWTGMSGGQRLWDRIATFFADLGGAAPDRTNRGGAAPDRTGFEGAVPDR
ncbi:DUF5947 family protein [Nonomuraea sp. NPDC049309]|uniref:DUF5947 family protein n=1 Tax=Nonomuraea sp. NPDC049309 TaxID=3364350 RepID=UPI003718ADBC